MAQCDTAWCEALPFYFPMTDCPKVLYSSYTAQFANDMQHQHTHDCFGFGAFTFRIQVPVK